MAATKKAANKKKTAKGKQAKPSAAIYMLTGLVFILFGIFGLFKLGFLGTLITNVFRILVGNTYPIFAIVIILYGLLLLLLGKEPKFRKKNIWIGMLLFYFGLLIFLHALLFKGDVRGQDAIIQTTWQFLKNDVSKNQVSVSVGGGMIGSALYSLLHLLVSQVGSYLVSVVMMVIGVLVFFNFRWSMINEKAQEKFQKMEKNRQEKKKLKKQQPPKTKNNKNNVRPITPGEQLAQENKEAFGQENESEPEQLTLQIDNYQEAQKKMIPRQHSNEASDSDETDEELHFEITSEPEDRDYVLPPTNLLNDIPTVDQSGEYALIEKNVAVLENTFKSFGVDAKVVRASLGPAVTKYEIQPAVGVKVSKIVNLTDDLALALAAKDIRMEAPIPGKSLIGIEVPNNTVSTVSFRDIVEAQTPHPDKLLEVPLGRDIGGAVITADLAKMPHMLIAGSTGSGKSVCINGIITGILMQAKPNEVKLMMIDPKMVELNVYNGIPHLLTPVVTNPKKAAQALYKVVQEMEKRYELFAGCGVRNITGYNEFITQKNMETGDNRPILPFIVVIVDELADLMMVASNEVEDAITRLAQMARAAGIHMILATQRPSVDVITGIIKANVPSRIAFAVSSGTDSRTIIDTNGAEKLLGRGDMLFLPMGENKPIRVQGAFISDQEVEQIVDYVRGQQEVVYQEEMMPSDEVEVERESSQDELYQDAVELVVEMKTASVSLLQRRFRIGYNRAARLVDEMEMNGIVGPSEGSKPRKVLVSFLPEDADGAIDPEIEE